YPDDWARILEEGNRHPPMTLRINCRRTTVPAYLDLLQENGIAARAVSEFGIKLEQPVPVGRLPAFDAGRVSVQDRAAQYAAPLLDVADGMRVLDACSAPGGKAAHLLELAAVDLLALDHDAERLDMVARNLDRLGLKATLRAADAAADTWWDGEPFDRILADAPCSASGVVRRNPDIKWLRRQADLEGFAVQQARILDRLWRCLARGGKLLYGTCSVFAEENQQQIANFLRRHPDAKPRFPVGIDGQLLPSDQQDGFYYALLHKS
ncbi:MAG TPA: 16S rRNA (cytosine(967)-C(5))-methyltransferase RsmB, partial [Betaproteobacteria bacterium]|nr:16S rRNA (cytosine(967)-C(5))-methyltransferase RsmB [Betaproteobacteria bacterium]